ncbi:MAG: hypothetical protein M0Z31_00330 [Clostridia bacterium]|nr:hypothetical protein [Clostridia bacterium]
MNLQSRQAADVSDTIGLLISILVRYSEVASINFDPQGQALKFTFIFSGYLSKEDQETFEVKLWDYLDAYLLLEDKNTEVASMQWIPYDKFSILELTRDVDTLSQEEIAIIITLVKEDFGHGLVSENSDSIAEEDLMIQEELIGHMLENLKGSRQEKKLIAFREEGKVLVFNK